jgi:hypothetical protein
MVGLWLSITNIHVVEYERCVREKKLLVEHAWPDITTALDR